MLNDDPVYYREQLCFSLILDGMVAWGAVVERDRDGMHQEIVILGVDEYETLCRMIDEYLDASGDDGDEGFPDDDCLPKLPLGFTEALRRAEIAENPFKINEFLSRNFSRIVKVEEANGCKIFAIQLGNGHILYVVFDPNKRCVGATMSKERALELADRFGRRTIGLVM